MVLLKHPQIFDLQKSYDIKVQQYIGINAMLPITKKDIIRTAWGKYTKLTILANSLKLVSTGSIILNWNQKKNKYTTIMKKNLGNIDVSYIILV